MLNCNLVKFIHNKWLQEFDNMSGDLYVVTMDDYILVFLQVIVYHQFLKGGIGVDGLNKKELKF
jgi:hypothetical protein